MAKQLDTHDLVTFQDLTLSNMWEVAAVIEVLEKKELLTKKEILDAIRELRQKNPKARISLEIEGDPQQQAFPEPYLLTETHEVLITRIMELMNESKLNAHQAKALLH